MNLAKENNFISIIIYINNDSKKIIGFFEKIDTIMKEKFNTYEYILIDDNSSDNSVEVIKEFLKSYKLTASVTLLELPWKHGKENSMIAGIDAAIGDFVYEFDTIDIDYDLDIVLKVYYKMLEGYDIVSAVPKENRKFSSKLFYNILNFFSNSKIKVRTETFRIISRRAINRIFKSRERFKYRKILYHYSGFDTYLYEYSRDKANKISNDELKFSEKLEFATDILIVFSDFGVKFSLILSLLFFSVGVFSLIYTITAYMFIKQIQPGWTTIMLFLSLSFSGIFFILGIIIKYLNILVKEIQAKDIYTYKKISKLN